MRAWLGVASILVAGIALRIFDLGRLSFWLDEGYSVLIASRPLGTLLRGDVGDAHTPPLYYLLLHVWTAAGDSDAWVRGLSAFFSILLLLAFIVYLRVAGFEREQSLAALALLSISPFQVYYAQEARMYSLAMLLAVALVIAEMQAMRRGGWTWNLSLVVLGTLGLYTHYYLAFVMLGCFLLRLAGMRRPGSPDTWRRLFATHAAVGLLFLPWVTVVLRLAHSGGQQFREHLFSVLPYAAVRMIVGYGVLPIDIAFKRDPWAAAAHAWPWLAVVFAAWALCGVGLLRRFRSGQDRDLLLAQGTVLGCTAILPLVISFKVPMYSERYLGVVHPIVIAVVVAGIYGWPRRVARISVAVLAVVMLTGTATWLFGTSSGKANWKAAAALLQRDALPGDAILLDGGYTHVVLDRYVPAGLDVRRVDAASFAGVSERCAASGTAPSERTWVVLSHTKRKPGDYDRALAPCARRVREVVFPEEVGIEVLLFSSPP